MTDPKDIIGIVKELQEEWRPVKNWDAYEVSNLGRVRSLHRAGRIRKPHKTNGYLYIDLWQGGDCLHIAVHRLVLYAFGPPATPDMECNHVDGNKSNNRIDNLEWVTRSYNQIHAIRMGLATPTKHSPYQKGHTPWNRVSDRTCIECAKPNSIVARRMCKNCWQRWDYHQKQCPA